MGQGKRWYSTLLIAALSTTGCGEETTTPPPPPAVEADCFRGMAHLDCDDSAPRLIVERRDGSPTIYEGYDRYLWFRGLTPPEGFEVTATPPDHYHTHSESSYGLIWGTEPRTRDTAMVLSLSVGEVPDLPTGTRCTCEYADAASGRVREGGCLGSPSLCAEIQPVRPIVAHPDWSPSASTVAWTVAPDILLSGYALMLEVDIDQMRGRGCLLYFDDAMMRFMEPKCAPAGQIELSSRPTSVEEVGTLDVRYHLEFPDDFAPNVLNLVIDGQIEHSDEGPWFMD